MSFTEIGPRGYKEALAAASVTLTPLADRALIVRRIFITGQSAADTWVLSVSGKEVGRFVENALGNQQLLGGLTSVYPKTKDIFDYLKAMYDMELIYPIPQGCTLTISSVGGATANIVIEYTEHPPAEVSPSLMNHPQGTRRVAPLYGVPKTSYTAAGDNALASTAGLSYAPSIFTDGALPQGWRVTILGLFLEGAGVNTYNGSADHQSVTDHLALTVNGQQKFTRDTSGGIPVVGAASATGSANKVFNSVMAPLPAFQLSDEYDWANFASPLTIGPGDLYQWRLNLTGSLTGGADYSSALQVAICDITGSAV